MVASCDSATMAPGCAQRLFFLAGVRNKRSHDCFRGRQRGCSFAGGAFRHRPAAVCARGSKRAACRLAERSAGRPAQGDRRHLPRILASAGDPREHRRSLSLSVRPDPRGSGARAARARFRSGPAHRRARRRHPHRHGCGGRRHGRDAAAAQDEGRSSAFDRALRHRRRLAGDARHRGADRCGGDRDAMLGALSAGPGSGAGPHRSARPRRAGGGLRPHRAGDGQDGRGRAELFERCRPDRLLRRRQELAEGRHRTAAVLRADRARRDAADAAAHRRRLRIPRRPAIAPRSGLDAGRGLDRVRARLLRARRAAPGSVRR